MLLCFMLYACARSRLGSFVLGMMLHYVISRLFIYIPNYLCKVNVIFQQGKGKLKHITKKVIKFPNQSNLLTLV